MKLVVFFEPMPEMTETNHAMLRYKKSLTPSPNVAMIKR